MPKGLGGYQPDTRTSSSRRADFDLRRRIAKIEQDGGGGGGGGIDEVWIGPSAPADPNVELWFDSDAPGGGGVGTDEVWIDAATPIDPNIELWFDTDAVADYAKGDPGEPGAPGAKGDKGDKGDQGDPGPASSAGTLILSGSGPPALVLGDPGNFYLDQTAQILYGPKRAEALGPPISGRDTTAIATWNPAPPHVVGDRYRFPTAGQITTLRFYRATQETATNRTIRLYSGTGTLLAETAATADTGVGWIEGAITPYIVTANQEIVVSLNRPNGHNYSLTTATGKSEIVWVRGQYLAGTGVYPPTTDNSATYGTDVVYRAADTNLWPIALKGAP